MTAASRCCARIAPGKCAAWKSSPTSWRQHHPARSASRSWIRSRPPLAAKARRPNRDAPKTLRDFAFLALVKYLDKVPEDEIVELNIPTGMPLTYELDDDLKPLKRYYLGDPEKVQAAMEAVAAQGKKTEPRP